MLHKMWFPVLVALLVVSCTLAVPVEEAPSQPVDAEPQASENNQEAVQVPAAPEDKSDLEGANTFWGGGYYARPYYGGWGGGYGGGWRRGYGGYGYGRGYGGYGGWGWGGGYGGYGGWGRRSYWG